MSHKDCKDGVYRRFFRNEYIENIEQNPIDGGTRGKLLSNTNHTRLAIEISTMLATGHLYLLNSRLEPLKNETSRLFQTKGIMLNTISLGNIYQNVLIALEKLCNYRLSIMHVCLLRK